MCERERGVWREESERSVCVCVCERERERECVRGGEVERGVCVRERGVGVCVVRAMCVCVCMARQKRTTQEKRR